MEGSSFAKEIYGEIASLSKNEFGPSSRSGVPDEDGPLWDDCDEDWDKSTSLDREWQKRHDQYHTIGYRDGLLAAKDAIAQEGFNAGFKQSVLVGYKLGVVRGVTSAFLCLPDELKERLVETQEERNKFRGLLESVDSLSTTDALKLYHDDVMMMKKKAAEMGEIAVVGSGSEGPEKESSVCSQLESFSAELESMLLESPAIKSHLSLK